MNTKAYPLRGRVVKIGILFLYFFICNLIVVQPDVLHLCEDMVINGKLLNIVFRGTENQILEYVIIDSEIGTLKIDGDSILNYWITSNPNEDISIYKQLGKHLSKETYIKIKDNYDYSVEVKIDILEAENTVKEKEMIDSDEVEEENKVTEVIEVSSIKELPEADEKKAIPVEQTANTSRTNSGFGLTIGGSSLLLAGASILVYDIAFYSDVVRNNLNKIPKTEEAYDEYNTSYTIFMTLLVGGGVSLVSGTILLFLGIPDLIKKNENKVLNPDIVITTNGFEAIGFQINIKM